VGLIVAALGAAPLVGALVRSRRSLWLAVAANVLSIVLAFLVAESVLRLALRSSPDGLTVAGVPLRPTWSDLVAQIHAMPAATRSFFLYDAELGWTVGPGRRSPDGIYLSSAEGIRSDVQGIRYRDEAAAFRVALIGDSNAFSLEVPFEESWGCPALQAQRRRHWVHPARSAALDGGLSVCEFRLAGLPGQTPVRRH
jgi:hypothetical protein